MTKQFKKLPVLILLIALTLGVPLVRAQARTGTGDSADRSNIKNASGEAVPNARVNVETEAPRVESERAERAAVFSDKQLRELPIANRRFDSLIDLAPGVTPPEPRLSPLLDPGRSPFVHVHGQSAWANDQRFDGLENNEPLFGQPIYTPSAEAAQELGVATVNYRAEKGQAGGGVFNLLTRDGVNAFHGSLYEFHLDNRLRSRDFFNTAPQPKPVFVHNQFGATLSGPIIRDKSFWFAAYEGDYTRGATTQITTVPVAAWRSGNFSGVAGLSLYDPATGSGEGVGRSLFAGATLPAGRLSPVAQQLVSLLPQPNLPGLVNNLAANVPLRQDANRFDGRLDHHFTDQTSAFLKYSFSRAFLVEDSPLGPAVAESAQSRVRTHTAAASVSHSFSPSLLAEVRFAYQQYNPKLYAGNVNQARANQLGIANPNAFALAGVPRLEIAGMPGLGAAALVPTRLVDQVHDGATTWGWSSGRHQFRWGAEVERLRPDGLSPLALGFAPRGLFSFGPGPTALSGSTGLGPSGAFAHAFAAFLLGVPTQSSLSVASASPAVRQWQYFTFLQDSLKVSPKLTLELGLRYEVYGTAKPLRSGGASRFNPASNSLELFASEVNSFSDLATDWNNLAPRFGFAYQLGQQSVVRGGYGISYFQPPLAFSGAALASQFPVVSTAQQGVLGGFGVGGSLSALPLVASFSAPGSGTLSPAPNQPLVVLGSEDRTPYVQQFNLTLEHDFGAGLLGSVAYVGSLGRKLPYTRELNASALGAGVAGLPLNSAFGHTAPTLLRGFGLSNNYHALEASASKRFNQSLAFTAAYTYSKALDYASDLAPLANPLNLRSNYGLADYDRTHVFTLSHLFELPFGSGRRWLSTGVLGYVLGNWQFNGILRAATGTPVSATVDPTLSGAIGSTVYANVSGPVQTLGNIGPGQFWFDPSAFSEPGANQFGSGARNQLRGPGFGNYNLSLFRLFPIMERANLEFRAEVYNLTNTTIFPNPAGNYNLGSFGQISSPAYGFGLYGFGGREVQFSARILF
jgi:TonB dependent receptor